MTEKPERCVSPILKECENCQWGLVQYPDWVETYEDTQGCCFDTVCVLGYDRGRPEDEPTEAEMEKFDKWCRKVYDDGQHLGK